MIDPGKAPGETGNGPRESRLPSGQAAGRWYSPPPLGAAAVKARRQRSVSTHISAYMRWITCARIEEPMGRTEPKPRSTDRRMAQLALRKWLSLRLLLTWHPTSRDNPPRLRRDRH